MSRLTFKLELEEKSIRNSPTTPSKDKNSTTKDINQSQNIEESAVDLKLCDSPFIYNNEKYLVDKNQNRIISLYSTFKFLRAKYKLENSRKNQIDCLIKKVKTKFIKALHEAIKYCVNLYIRRLPQHFVTNIKIDYNKIYLNKTINEIYTEFKIIPPLKELIDRKLYRKGKKELLIFLMTGTMQQIYQYYLVSDFYKYHYRNIKRKEGENVAKLFEFTAHNICQYFLFNKGNKKKIKKKNVNNNINNNINININNNFKYISHDVKFISSNTCLNYRCNTKEEELNNEKANIGAHNRFKVIKEN